MKTGKQTLTRLALGITTVAYCAFAHSGTLYEGEYLFPGQQLISDRCYLGTFMQADRNLLTYTNARNSPPGPACWATGTQARGGYATLQSDNNFVIYNWADEPVWATRTNGWGYDELVQQSDGKLVLYGWSWFGIARTPFWASNAYGESLAQSPCSAKSLVTRVSADTDLPGVDYNAFTIPVPGPSWCGYYCVQDSKGQAYTYFPPGVQASNAVCWLKAGIPGARYAPGMVSGYKITR